ncbi:MAG: MerR family transcriptional regulator [Aristaeellaceae bacterium]
MMTIGEMSRISHLSVRTLRHYDRIGLLRPCGATEAGYRLYDEDALKRLHTILLFRELEFPLADIRRILDTPGFDPLQALETQITLLTMRREHLDNLIALARGMKLKGLNHMSMNFDAFDTRKLDDYAAQAKAAWGSTPAYREFEQKQAARTPGEDADLGQQLMAMLVAFGQRRRIDPACEEAQAMVQQLRDFLTANFYNCTLPILGSLADMYDGGGDFTRNIDHAAGEGAASFLARAMRAYCNIHRDDP